MVFGYSTRSVAEICSAYAQLMLEGSALEACKREGSPFISSEAGRELIIEIEDKVRRALEGYRSIVPRGVQKIFERRVSEIEKAVNEPLGR